MPITAGKQNRKRREEEKAPGRRMSMFERFRRKEHLARLEAPESPFGRTLSQEVLKNYLSLHALKLQRKIAQRATVRREFPADGRLSVESMFRLVALSGAVKGVGPFVPKKRKAK